MVRLTERQLERGWMHHSPPTLESEAVHQKRLALIKEVEDRNAALGRAPLFGWRRGVWRRVKKEE
jgi:hypothetical protein